MLMSFSVNNIPTFFEGGFFYAHFSFTKLTIITNSYITKVSRTFGASKQ
jgi:hypothetical protein